MTTVMDTFRDFANAPKNRNVREIPSSGRNEGGTSIFSGVLYKELV